MKVRVEKSGNRILLGSDRPTALSDGSIPGAYFRKDKFWSLPLSMTTCYLLRERFGNRLEIGPDLTAWARAEKAGRQTAQSLSVAADAELKLLPEVAPKLAQAMESRTYQRVAARYVADSAGRDGCRRALIADTVGLGKSAEALAGVLESGIPGPYLIVCPKTAVNSTWANEIRRWLPDDEVVTLPEGKAAREKVLNNLFDRGCFTPAPDLERTWVVVHPYSIRTQTWWVCRAEEVDAAGTPGLCGAKTKFKAGVVKELDCGHDKAGSRTENEHVFPQLFGMQWGAVIIDESDQILIRLTGTPNLQRRGAEMLRDAVVPGGIRLAMSGTPTRSKPHQIWSTLNWLDPVRFSSKWNFIKQYWNTESGTFGGINIGDMQPERERMLDEELSDVLLRRRREDVRGDLPAKLYAGSPLDPADDSSPIGVWLDMEGEQLKAYTDMEKYATANLEGGSLTPVGILAEMTRLRQFAGAPGRIVAGEFLPVAKGNKFDWIVNFLQELGLPGEPSTKVVIASQFTRLLKAFGDGILKHSTLNGKDSRLRLGYITGEESQKVRDANVEDFEEGSMNVLLINTKAGGSSITLDAAEVMVILDETWVDDEQEQLEGRIDNRKPERRIVPRTYYYLRSKNTIEARIAAENAQAKAAGKKLLDGGASRLAKKVMS